MVSGHGVSGQFATERVEGDLLTFAQPLGLPDVSTASMVAARRTSYALEGILSLLTIPLPIGGERRAALVVYHRTPHDTTETELRVGIALGHLVAAAIWNAETYEALDRSTQAAERHAAQMVFLAEVSAKLGSLDYETTLRQIAELAVPAFTDWCAVDVVMPDERVQRLITAHVDPAKMQLARTLEEKYPTGTDTADGVPEVLRTGRPIHYPLITDAMLAAGARSEEHLAILRALGVHSAAIVPLTARGRTLGALTFVSASADRPLTGQDFVVLTEIGRRAGIAVDNARLYRDAERANTAKDEFLALLSHELRTPLNAIMGWTHMLRSDLPEEMRAHAIEVIGRNARSQKQLVEDLLDVARIAGGRLDLLRTDVDLCDIARVGVDSALPAAQAKGITLVCETANQPLMLHADPDRLQQLIANLVSNGVKFTDAGGRVTVRARRAPEGVELTVEDNGAGIPEAFLPNIFDRFRQGDTSLTRAYGGLGLGLWVVKQIADAHGASVRAESDGAGHGATLTVTWPVSRST
jgi:signal transduction histidine kinase